MANEQELIETLRRQTKAIGSLVDAIKANTEANAQLATAVHALADSLAACTTTDAPTEDPEPDADEPQYADGTPMGGAVPRRSRKG